MIDHEGIIEHIEGNRAHVRIDSASACAACHAKGGCGAAGQEVKFLDVPLRGGRFSAGDKVQVLVSKGLGLRAVALGYVYPLILVLAVLVTLVSTGVGELPAAMLALGSLLPYYLVIYLTRNRIGQKFTFSMHKTHIVQ